jgi:hypothetical protein
MTTLRRKELLSVEGIGFAVLAGGGLTFEWCLFEG